MTKEVEMINKIVNDVIEKERKLGQYALQELRPHVFVEEAILNERKRIKSNLNRITYCDRNKQGVQVRWIPREAIDAILEGDNHV